MAAVPQCSLCGSDRVEVIDRIATAGIAGGYDPAVTSVVAENLKANDELSFCRCRECDLRYFWPMITGSSKYYDALQRFAWYYIEDKPEYQIAKQWVSPGDRVLEIGCGRGAFSTHIDPSHYTGLEFSTEAVQSAVDRGLDVTAEPIEQHAREHPQSYDVVCAFQVLEHVAPVEPFIEASVGAMKPGGLLLYCVPSEDSYISLLRNAVLNMPPHHVTRWTDQALRSVARVFGLEVVAIDHEILAPMHVTTYSALIAERMLRRVLHLEAQKRLLDTSLRQRMLDKAAYRLGRLIEKGLDEEKLYPRGHSVLAVYRKAA